MQLQVRLAMSSIYGMGYVPVHSADRPVGHLDTGLWNCVSKRKTQGGISHKPTFKKLPGTKQGTFSSFVISACHIFHIMHQTSHPEGVLGGHWSHRYIQVPE